MIQEETKYKMLKWLQEALAKRKPRHIPAPCKNRDDIKYALRFAIGTINRAKHYVSDPGRSEADIQNTLNRATDYINEALDKMEELR